MALEISQSGVRPFFLCRISREAAVGGVLFKGIGGGVPLRNLWLLAGKRD